MTLREWVLIGEIWLLIAAVITLVLYYFFENSIVVNIGLGAIGSIIATGVGYFGGWMLKQIK